MSETPPIPNPPVEPVGPVAAPAAPTAAPAAPTAQTAPAPLAPRRGNGFGLAALILGIVALLGAAFPFVNVVSGILAFIGLILGIVGLTRTGAAKGTSIAGTIISGVAILIVIVSSIILSLGLAALDEAISDPGATDPAVVEPTEAPIAPDEPTQIPEGDPGSFTNPVPLGVGVTFTIANVDEWFVTVQSSTLNANDLVVAADPGNLPAADDSQYALVDARFEHVGPDLGTPSDDLAIFFATDPATLYFESDVAAIAPAPAWRDIVDLQRASIAGNAIVLIPKGATGVWAINPVGTDLIVYFATQ